MRKAPHAIVRIGPPTETKRWHCRCGWRGDSNQEHKAHHKAALADNETNNQEEE